MMQLGTETGLENLGIKPGDIVRLLQPFRPDRYYSREYTFAIVAGIVGDGNVNHLSHQKYQPYSDFQSVAEEHLPGADGIVAYLYEPHTSTLYTDRHGSLALFSFDSNEVEIV